MSFGDVLDEWEKIKRENPGLRGGQASPPPKAPPPTVNEDLLAYLNRHGVVDKDAGGRDEEAEEAAERADSREWLAMPAQANVDLHGLTEAEAITRLRIFIDQSLRQGLRKILIVHGKGNHSVTGESVLARSVARFLERHPMTGRSGTPPRNEGGRGATWVILRPKRD
jgi:DNA-nicking Smr family endonuclease